MARITIKQLCGKTLDGHVVAQDIDEIYLTVASRPHPIRVGYAGRFRAAAIALLEAWPLSEADIKEIRKAVDEREFDEPTPDRKIQRMPGMIAS